jgi:hypothetical protein
LPSIANFEFFLVEKSDKSSFPALNSFAILTAAKYFFFFTKPIQVWKFSHEFTQSED